MEWISVKDQAPPTGEELLVIKRYLETDYSEKGYHPDKAFWTRPIIQLDYLWSDTQWDKGGEATHWMPLPKPPKEDKCVV